MWFPAGRRGFDPTCSRRCEMACMTRSKCRDSNCRLPGSSSKRPWLLACEPAGLRAWVWASCWCWRRVAMSCCDRPRRSSATDEGVAVCGGERWWSRWLLRCWWWEDEEEWCEEEGINRASRRPAPFRQDYWERIVAGAYVLESSGRKWRIDV